LAGAATFAGDLFPAAVRGLRDLVGPIQHAEMLLDALQKARLGTTAPEACLELMTLVTPHQPSPWFGPLRNFLEELRAVRPALADDLTFQRLHDIAIQAGL
jgi:hypothetical protein